MILTFSIQVEQEVKVGLRRRLIYSPYSMYRTSFPPSLIPAHQDIVDNQGYGSVCRYLPQLRKKDGSRVLFKERTLRN